MYSNRTNVSNQTLNAQESGLKYLSAKRINPAQVVQQKHVDLGNANRLVQNGTRSHQLKPTNTAQRCRQGNVFTRT